MAASDQSVAQPVKTSWLRMGLAFIIGAALMGFVFDRCFREDEKQIQTNPYVRVTAETLTVRPNPVDGATAVEVAVFGPGGQGTQIRGVPGDTFHFDLVALNLNPRQQVVARYFRSRPGGGETLMFLDSMRTEDSFLGGDVDMGYHVSAPTERINCPPPLTGRVNFTPNAALGGGYFEYGDLATEETYEIRISGCVTPAQTIRVVIRRRLDGTIVTDVFDHRSHDCYSQTYMACDNAEIVFDESGCRFYVQSAPHEAYIVGCSGCTIEVFR